MTPEEELVALKAELEAVKANRAQIIEEKRALVAARVPADMQKVRDTMRELGIRPSYEDATPTDRVLIQRHCPPAEYQRLRADALKRGVPYVVEDAATDPALSGHARPTDSRIKFVEDEKTFFANQAMQREVGIVELTRRASAAGKVLRIFRNVEDLSPEAQAKHARLEVANDPDDLVFGS
jgi:hypothetical protein